MSSNNWGAVVQPSAKLDFAADFNFRAFPFQHIVKGAIKSNRSMFGNCVYAIPLYIYVSVLGQKQVLLISPIQRVYKCMFVTVYVFTVKLHFALLYRKLLVYKFHEN